MTRPRALLEAVSANLTWFFQPTCEKLPKPRKKFLRDGLVQPAPRGTVRRDILRQLVLCRSSIDGSPWPSLSRLGEHRHESLCHGQHLISPATEH